MNSQHVNLAGIGAGPFNLSVAALLNKVSGMQAAFFDKKPRFNWHPGLMLDDAKLQTSWMKDLVTPADPTSPFSFLNFLVQKGRFYSFINAEQSAISRQEFAQYLAWVAEQLPSAQFGSHVREINYKQNKFWLRFDDKIISADHLCVGTGTQPFVPSFATKTTEESAFSDLARKAMGLWFKQQRELIGRWCVGVSRIAINDAAVERLAGPKMQAAMPCPIFAAVADAEARQWLENQFSVFESNSR